jgi:hypothetical protein
MDQRNEPRELERIGYHDSAASGILADIVFAVLLLIAIPLAGGFIRFGILWFGLYAVLAATVFSTVAWLRERRHREVSAETIAMASLARLAVVFVVGGICYAAALMIH